MPALDVTATATLMAPNAPIGTLQDDWFNGLSAAATTGKIKARWDAKVGTDPLWLKYVANVSSAGYKHLPYRHFESRHGRSQKMILGAQKRKLAAAGAAAKTAHDLMFASGASNFLTEINNKAGNFSAHIRESLSAVGCSLLNKLGPAPFVAACIASDPRALAMKGGPLEFSGVLDPFDFPLIADRSDRYLEAGMAVQARAAIEGYVAQTLIFIMTGVLQAADLTLAVTGTNVVATALLKRYLLPAYNAAATMTFSGGPGTATCQVHIDGDAPFVP